MVNMEEENKIMQLWRNPNFSGSYSGLANFQTCLKNEKNIDISRNKLLTILNKDRDYALEMRKVTRKINRRPMNIHGYGNLFQADLGQLYTFSNFTYFLLCIDVYSRRIFCRKLMSKKANEVQKAFKSIFLEANVSPEKLETDQGPEFTSLKTFFASENIFFKIKIGANKAR